MNNNNLIGRFRRPVEGIVIALISALVIYFFKEFFPFVLNNIWMIIAIATFITFIVLILIRIIRKICKVDNKDIKKTRIISGVFSLILIVGVIVIITFIPPNNRNENNTRVPGLIGMEIIKASYEAYYAELELKPIMVKGYEVTFQDPQEGSLVMKNTSVKVVIGKPTIEITFLPDNSSVSSYCHLTGNSSGVVSNYPNLKIYVLIYNFSTCQVQKPPPPQSNGKWQVKCVFENLPGERLLIYAIITTQEIKEKQLDEFPICVAMADPINITRPE